MYIFSYWFGHLGGNFHDFCLSADGMFQRELYCFLFCFVLFYCLAFLFYLLFFNGVGIKHECVHMSPAASLSGLGSRIL